MDIPLQVNEAALDVLVVSWSMAVSDTVYTVNAMAALPINTENITEVKISAVLILEIDNFCSYRYNWCYW